MPEGERLVMLCAQKKEKQKPVSPYGHSKLMVEQILKDLHQQEAARAADTPAADPRPPSDPTDDHNPD